MFQKAIVEGDRKQLILGVAEPETGMCQNQMVLAQTRNHKPHIPLVSHRQVEVKVFPCGNLCTDLKWQCLQWRVL